MCFWKLPVHKLQYMYNQVHVVIISTNLFTLYVFQNIFLKSLLQNFLEYLEMHVLIYCTYTWFKGHVKNSLLFPQDENIFITGTCIFRYLCLQWQMKFFSFLMTFFLFNKCINELTLHLLCSMKNWHKWFFVEFKK